MTASVRFPPVVQALTTHWVAAPRLLLVSGVVISTHRLTWASLSITRASLRAAEVVLAFALALAFAEDEALALGELLAAGDLVADELFFASAELDGLAFVKALADELALLLAAGVDGPLAGGLVAVGFLVGVGVADGVGEELGVVADGDVLGAVVDGDGLGVADAVAEADGDELDDAEELGVSDAVADCDEPEEATLAAGVSVWLTVPPPLRPDVVPALRLVLALAEGVGVGVALSVGLSEGDVGVSDGDVGVSDGEVGGGSDGEVGESDGVVEGAVFVSVGDDVGEPVGLDVGDPVGDDVGPADLSG
jgi:hypothetical protein